VETAIELAELRKNDAKTLLALQSLDGSSNVDELIRSTELDESAVTRALLSLSEQDLVTLREEPVHVLKLLQEGKMYAELGLPEQRVVSFSFESGGKISIVEATRRLNIPDAMIPVIVGWIQTKNLGKIVKFGQELYLEVTEKPVESRAYLLLRMLLDKKELVLEDLSREDQTVILELKKRKLVEETRRNNRLVELTTEGWHSIEKGVQFVSEVSSLTPELITSGRWRETRLRRYNITAPVAEVWPGKRQPYNRFLDELRLRLVALGFKEMTGSIVEIMFFNCDSLFMPQDHPAREIHDIYFVKEPERGNLDRYRDYLQNVRETHENGWKTGSRGWSYDFSEKESSRLVLRSHGTALSARTLISKNLRLPGKYFSIARCFRPEVTDRTHLTEFNQVEGIVVGENLTLCNLLGVLERFAIELAGADKVKFRPDYFPFTEPSVELAAYKEGYGWLEFGGSGIFRPELTLPLGVRVPVLAWGLGVDRLFMMSNQIDDIRDLFTQDLNWIRRKEVK
jgi:phenylalanyl-tRNA synthetase alpha chain